MTFFDIHSHINDDQFLSDFPDVLSRMRERMVATIVVGTDKKLSSRAVDIAESEPDVYASVGQHPRDNMNEEFDEEWYDMTLSKKSVVAVGECGLDYFRFSLEEIRGDAPRQKDLFEKHIYLATKHNKPLMIHTRNAHTDMLDILQSKKRELGDALYGNIHFFTEGIETAERYFELDFTLSFTGVITFTSDYNHIIQNVPLSMILSETDCPYVAPVPYRGKRNEPTYVVEVVKKIAEIRGEDFEKVERVLYENARRVFRIDSEKSTIHSPLG